MRQYSVLPLVLALAAYACGGPPSPENADDTGKTSGGRGSGRGDGGRSGGGDSSGDDGQGGGNPSGDDGQGGRNSGSGGSVEIVVGAENCGLENPAFCEDFEDASATVPGGRGGDLDEARFAFSRWGHTLEFFDRLGAYTQRSDELYSVQRNRPVFCGEEFKNLIIGQDARICPGPGVGNLVSNQFNEVFDDSGDFGLNSLMIRQPFDFSEGGVLVFDVDGKRNHYYEGHGWWFEVWITEDPAPVPYHTAPTVSSFPRNGLGIQFSPIGTCLQKETEDCNEVAVLFLSRNYQIYREIPGSGDFPRRGGFVARDQELNHFEVRVSPEHIEIWATDAGKTNLYLVQEFSGLSLPFTRGFVHFQHSQYNSWKDGRPQYSSGVWASPAQTYRWDNLGFDGPKLPLLRSYDAPLNNNKREVDFHADTTLVKYGYHLSRPVTVEFDGVDLDGATKALLNVNVNLGHPRQLDYKINGGEKHTFPIPDYGNAGSNFDGLLRAVSIEVPVGELVSGKNKVEFSIPDYTGGSEMIGNIDLSLVVP